MYKNAGTNIIPPPVAKKPLINPAIIADTQTWLRMQNDIRVAEMPCYPADGSMAIIDDILVVKMGE